MSCIRAANFIRQNQRGQIHRKFLELRRNRNLLHFWCLFENAGPIDGCVQLTHWTFEKVLTSTVAHPS
jgi:hypothetical protein